MPGRVQTNNSKRPIAPYTIPLRCWRPCSREDKKLEVQMNRKLITPALLLVLTLMSLLFAMSAAQAQTSPVPCTTPGISFWKLLDAVRVGYGDGRLSIDKLYAVCLPTPAKQSTSNYAYDPDVGGKLS